MDGKSWVAFNMQVKYGWSVEWMQDKIAGRRSVICSIFNTNLLHFSFHIARGQSCSLFVIFKMVSDTPGAHYSTPRIDDAAFNYHSWLVWCG